MGPGYRRAMPEPRSPSAPGQLPEILRADFDEPAAARQAMIALEGQGIDADDIRLVDEPSAVPTQGATRGAELAATGDVARNYAGGATIGAVVGAGLLALVALLVGPDPVGPALAIAVVGGAVGGFFLGGYWGAAAKLPVNEEAFDTYLSDPQDSAAVRVEVRIGRPGTLDATAAVLRSHNARRVEHVS